MVTVLRGRVSHGAIVFSQPLGLAEGQEVVVQIAAADGLEEAAAVRLLELTSRPFFGMWANRTDLQDSDEWLRQQRESWHRRVLDQD